MIYDEDDYLLLSGIQHFAFCKRQWALIHIEQQWHENLRTVEGHILHETAHNDRFSEKRKGLLITRSMPIASRKLGITGVCDVVEFHKDETGISLFGQQGRYLPVPVEYKRGEPKKDHCDEMQLCAQAICLEEMLACDIPAGFLYYGETKHRQEVAFSVELRSEVQSVTEQMHDLFRRRHTPKMKTGSFCRACSMNELCLPRLGKIQSVSNYINGRLGEKA